MKVWIGCDLFMTIEEGKFYGFPYYYQHQGKIIADPAFVKAPKATWVAKPPVAFCGFKAHFYIFFGRNNVQLFCHELNKFSQNVLAFCEN